jgi:hypothetical protein
MNRIKYRLYTYVADLAKPLTALLVVISLTLLTSNIINSQLLFSTRITNQGKVEVIGVGVYWDSNCTRIVSTIDWGVMTPGSTKNVTMFIRNEGNRVITLLFGYGELESGKRFRIYDTSMGLQ